MLTYAKYEFHIDHMSSVTHGAKSETVSLYIYSAFVDI